MLTDQIHIRSDLRPGDIGTIIHLHGSLYAQEYRLDYTLEGCVADSLARFALTFDPDRNRLWIAEMGGQIAGCIGVVGHSQSEAQLRWFLVRPAWRGHGLGQALLRRALQFCRERGFKSVFLWTFHGLDAAAHLYQSAGFRITEQKTHQIWGQTLTEERYDLSLSAPDAAD
jgi:GNAT superfamily N-acetyltransferase